jgi:general secretion pathway protein G
MTALYKTSKKLVRKSSKRKGFTLVEILIVVIILGILAAIVIPQFTNASTDARKSNMASQDQTIKSQISLYMLQHGDTPPTLQTSWVQLMGVTNATGQSQTTAGPTTFGPYLQSTPVNPLTASSTVVDISAPASTAGWVYNSTTGEFHGINATGAQSDDGN